MPDDLTNMWVRPESTIHQAIAQMDVNRAGIVLVVDQDRRLLGTITDGDIRRAMLADISQDEPVSVLTARKQGTPFENPITALVGTERADLLRILRSHGVLHLPLVDENQTVVDLVTLNDFVAPQGPPLQAVIMAGGSGSRLLPLTEDTPKPMLNVGQRPLMEIVLQQLREAGIKRVNVAVHHKSERITQHFGDGQGFGLDITYINEDRPLGTAGALALMQTPVETMLVMNGDILTRVDFQSMLAYHQENRADLTVGVQRYDLQVPYGVVECEDTFVRRLVEKPLLKFFVNAGIYMLEPMVYPFIPTGEHYDMTDLITRLLDEGRTVVAFPIREYWMDIGQAEDYLQAQEDVKGWDHTQ
jgi:dTDP-glucose pyrophosphorylase